MADEPIYETIRELHPRKTWTPAEFSWPRVSEITVSGWPNMLGETPDEVLGKLLKVTEGDLEAVFRIARIDGNTLHLKREPTR